MDGNVYRINKAGLYCIGHFRALGVKLEIGSPRTCGTIDLDYEQTAKLLDMLDIDWEDGFFLQDLLEGQNVLVGVDEQLYFKTIGDPYGNDHIEIGKGGA